MKNFFSAIFIFYIFSFPLFAIDEYNIDQLSEKIKNPVKEYHPSESIYLKGDILFCSGNDTVSLENNKSAELISNGEFEKAAILLEEQIKNASLFFPMRYNLALAYLYISDLKKAALNFRRAAALVPEFPRTYIQLGYISQLEHRDGEAIDYFRIALRIDKKDLNTVVMIGDIFINRRQFEIAKRYYDSALAVNHKFPNALIGRARIHFEQGEYGRVIILLKSIDRKGDYDKSFHYFYAESSFKIKDYATAVQQYEMLLTFKNDKFFLTTSSSLIKHKLDLSRRFVEK